MSVASLLNITRPTVKENCFADPSLLVADLSALSVLDRSFFEVMDKEHNVRYTDQQAKAILLNEKHLLIEAGAGSGKSTTIIGKAKYLVDVKGVSEKSICLVTFTNQASEDMKSRLTRFCGSYAKGFSVSTFHSLYSSLMREYYGYHPFPNILESSEQYAILERALQEAGRDKRSVEMKDVVLQITQWKNNMIGPDEAPSDHEFASVYRFYEKLKDENERYDFDDIQIGFLEHLNEDEFFHLFVQSKFEHIFVDEFQDVNRIQYELLKLMLSSKTKLQVVGDPRQAIYGFRGSNSAYIKNFCSDFDADHVFLSINFRSTEAIVQLGNNVAENNGYKTPLLSTKRTEWYPVSHSFKTDLEEAEFVADAMLHLNKSENVPFDEMAVLVRNHFYAERIVFELSNRNVPFVASSDFGSIYDRPAIRSMIAMTKLVNDENDMKSISKFAPSWLYISASEMKKLREVAKANGKTLLRATTDLSFRFGNNHVSQFLTYYDLSKSKYIDDPYNFIKSFFHRYLEPSWANKSLQTKGYVEDINTFLSVIKNSDLRSFDDLYRHIEEYNDDLKKAKSATTGANIVSLHGSKGLEWDTVFFVGHIDGFLPSKLSEDIEEERNIEYVGITRAKHRLYVTRPEDHSYSPTGRPSPFLSEMKWSN